MTKLRRARCSPGCSLARTTDCGVLYHSKHLWHTCRGTHLAGVKFQRSHPAGMISSWSLGQHCTTVGSRSASSQSRTQARMNHQTPTEEWGETQQTRTALWCARLRQFRCFCSQLKRSSGSKRSQQLHTVSDSSNLSAAKSTSLSLSPRLGRLRSRQRPEPRHYPARARMSPMSRASEDSGRRTYCRRRVPNDSRLRYHTVAEIRSVCSHYRR